jgi:hypothetical protein
VICSAGIGFGGHGLRACSRDRDAILIFRARGRKLKAREMNDVTIRKQACSHGHPQISSGNYGPDAMSLPATKHHRFIVTQTQHLRFQHMITQSSTRRQCVSGSHKDPQARNSDGRLLVELRRCETRPWQRRTILTGWVHPQRKGCTKWRKQILLYVARRFLVPDASLDHEISSRTCFKHDFSKRTWFEVSRI